MVETEKVRTIREKQMSIVERIKPYLLITSPYSVWNPEIMDFRVAQMTRTLTNNEIENRYLQGKYTPSDMYILRAIHYFGYAAVPAIEKLLQFWKRKDEEEAKKTGRELLCIPSGYGRLWSRLEMLCKNGVIACHEFFPPQQYRKVVAKSFGNDSEKLEGKANGQMRPMRLYSVTGNGAAMYRTMLQENVVSFDTRERYLGPDEIFRRVMCANMVASFLDNEYLSKVRFSYKTMAGRKTIQILSIIEMRAGNIGKDCRILMESITVHTNPRVVTKEHRVNDIRNRIAELKCALDESMKEMPTYILICAEDAAGIGVIHSCIEQIDPGMFRYCLITTGTVLEVKQTIMEPQKLAESFLEFDQSGNLQGATGYYFL